MFKGPFILVRYTIAKFYTCSPQPKYLKIGLCYVINKIKRLLL